MFFNIGPGEVFIILVAALIIFGPDRLPEVARQLGRWVRAFRRWTADITAEFNAITQELSGELDELRQVTKELQEELRGVQADLAHETRQISESFRLEDELGTGSATATSAYSAGPEMAGQTSGVGWSGSTAALGGAADAPAWSTNGSVPKMASKEDPTVDVALFDQEELVVMPRTERRLNGHHGLNGHQPAETIAPAPAAVPAAVPSPARRRSAAAVYQRQRRRGAATT